MKPDRLGVAIMGPPGSGKGTQSRLLSQKLEVPHLSTGDMLRADAEAGIPSAIAVRDAIARGQFAPDELVIEMVGRRLAAPDARDGYVLDGFPRTVAQAIALDALLASRGESANVIALLVDEDALIDRVRGRAEAETRAGRTPRADDTIEIFLDRMKIFKSTTSKVISYYADRGRLSEVDGMEPPETVHLAILATLARHPLTPTETDQAAFALVV